MSDIFRARFPRLFSPPALARIRGPIPTGFLAAGFLD
jgi:hypothetical protein